MTEPRRRSNWTALFGIWCAFLMRGSFYSLTMPIWGGYDEWAHFAYVQALVATGIPPNRSDPVSAEVCESLQLLPLSRFAGAAVGGGIHPGSFWRLPIAERAHHAEVLRMPPTSEGQIACALPAVLQYESQQPPLYYSLMAPIYRLFRTQPLPDRVLALRLWSVLIASTVVPLAFWIGVLLLHSARLALLATMVIAASPGFFINVSRVGNESLAIPAVSTLLLCSLIVLRGPGDTSKWAYLGVATAVALLTKAYALAFLPLIPLAALCACLREENLRKKIARVCMTAMLVALALAAKWYHTVWTATRTLSGEQMDVESRRFTVAQKLSALISINWREVFDSAAFSHIWVGGWSFLVARSWMYRAFECAALVAAIGLSVHLFRQLRVAWTARKLSRQGAGAVLLIATLFFMGAVIFYHAVVVFLVTNNSTAIGWYFYAVVAAETVGTALGFNTLFGRRFCLWGMALLVAMGVALDLYTVHSLLIPRYTGLEQVSAAGVPRAFPLQYLLDRGWLSDILDRLALFGAAPPRVLAVAWVAHLVATIGLAAWAVRLAARRPRPHGV